MLQLKRKDFDTMYPDALVFFYSFTCTTAYEWNADGSDGTWACSACGASCDADELTCPRCKKSKHAKTVD